MITEVKKSDDAVSPVVGVMLLLVVTVVIAAVVVGFSTSFAGETSQASMAMFDVEFIEMGSEEYGFNYQLADFGLVHKGGDELPLADLLVTIEAEGGGAYGVDGYMFSVQAQEYETAIIPTKDFLDTTGGYAYELSVIGQEDDVMNSVVSTGDVMRVALWDGMSSMKQWTTGITVHWTISEKHTTNIIAKGEFIIP